MNLHNHRQALIEAREYHHFTQADLAETLNRSTRHVQRIENGEADLTVHELFQWAEKCNTTPESLLGTYPATQLSSEASRRRREVVDELCEQLDRAMVRAQRSIVNAEKTLNKHSGD